MHNAPATSSIPFGLVALLALAVFAALAWLAWAWTRLNAVRAWQRLGEDIGGEFKAKSRLAPLRVVGTLHERPFVLETALSHEDDAPYFHTRGAFPVRNPGGFILGVRRKSLLEEAQTRRDTPAFDLDDPDFTRQFFVVCNDKPALANVLTSEVRRELARYGDIEVYARIGEIEWRRAGEVSDLRVIRRLNQTLADMATAIDALPKRTRTLTERLADDDLIAKGV